uniref:PD-(D/E)XK nuclease superfamily protein n=1 Tax=Myoviridae sp. ctj3P51 TaxID=2826687 RepID=A0A8S5NQV3_9CAUD|nr:MAG TPA: PD-(D/E)XK nuclease superfamily protein [Myoviridae sp. ctj3P51]
MHLSHSGLQLLLTCPASYFLSKKQGISLKKEAKALQVGSAFHWGCEHNTEDLKGYLDEIDPFQNLYNDFTKEVALATGMVHGYLKKKDSIYKQILKSYEGEDLTLVDEFHELDLLCDLPSLRFEKNHEFHGIIDLLMLTDKGWIILDYKTSSMRPDFDKYLDQVLRYCWMVEQKFPEMPIYKVGIINVRKTGIKQRQGENEQNYAMRIKREYDFDDCDLIEYHEFKPDDFEKSKMDLYIKNLSRMADFAQEIEDHNFWFINYGNAVSVYGKSEFWDLFYKTPDCKYLYKVYDPMFNTDLGEMSNYRDATDLDINSLEVLNPLNHYETFKEAFNKLTMSQVPALVLAQAEACRITCLKYCKEHYTTDDELLNRYWNELLRELNDSQSKVASGTGEVKETV